MTERVEKSVEDIQSLLDIIGAGQFSKACIVTSRLIPRTETVMTRERIGPKRGIWRRRCETVQAHNVYIMNGVIYMHPDTYELLKLKVDGWE